MMDGQDLDRKIGRLEKLLAAKCGATSGSLEKRLKAGGRRVPKPAKAAIEEILEAQRMAGHPKLGRVLNWEAVGHAFDTAEQELRAIDVADRRKGAILGALGGLVFNLLLASALLIGFLWYRGWLG